MQRWAALNASQVLGFVDQGVSPHLMDTPREGCRRPTALMWDGGDGEICPPNLPHLPGLKPQVGVLPRVEVRLPARQLPCLEPGCGLHTVWTVTMYMVQSLFMTPV